MTETVVTPVYYKHRVLSDWEKAECRRLDGDIPRAFIAEYLRCSLRDVFRVLEGESYLNMFRVPIERNLRTQEIDFRNVDPYYCERCKAVVTIAPCPACECKYSNANKRISDDKGYFVSDEERTRIRELFEEGYNCAKIGELLGRNAETILRHVRAMYPGIKLRGIYAREEYLRAYTGQNKGTPSGQGERPYSK